MKRIFPISSDPPENVDTYVKYHHLDLQKSDQDGKTKTYGPDQSDSSQFSTQPTHYCYGKAVKPPTNPMLSSISGRREYGFDALFVPDMPGRMPRSKKMKI